MTYSEQEVSSSQADIHILLVEDRKDTRAGYRRLFQLAGFTPIVAADVPSALSQLHATPELAVVVTDINFGDDDRWGGRALLSRIRSMNLHIPVVAYSAYYDESELSKAQCPDGGSDTTSFNRVFPKVSSESEFNEIVSVCRTLALDYLQKRRIQAQEALQRIESTYLSTEVHFEKLREFHLSGAALLGGDPEEMAVDEILRHEGYKFFLLQAGYSISNEDDVGSRTTSEPIPIWIRHESGSFVVAELYGHASIYAEGATESDAIEAMLVLMLGFFRDLETDQRKDDYPTTESLRTYLEKIFRERQ